MESATFWRRHARSVVFCCVGALQLPGLSLTAAHEPLADRRAVPAEGRWQLAQHRQCERRPGPFATQDTAWRRWRQAREQGLAVSRGVVPCHDQHGTRGYCFFVFYAC